MDHLRYIVIAFTHIDCTCGIDVKESYGFAGILVIRGQNLVQLVGLFLEYLLCHILLAQKDCIKLHPFCSAQRMGLIAGALYHHRDAELFQLLLYFRVVMNHSGLNSQIAAFVQDQFVIRGIVFASVDHMTGFHGIFGFLDIPAIFLGA